MTSKFILVSGSDWDRWKRDESLFASIFEKKDNLLPEEEEH